MSPEGRLRNVRSRIEQLNKVTRAVIITAALTPTGVHAEQQYFEDAPPSHVLTLNKDTFTTGEFQLLPPQEATSAPSPELTPPPPPNVIPEVAEKVEDLIENKELEKDLQQVEKNVRYKQALERHDRIMENLKREQEAKAEAVRVAAEQARIAAEQARLTAEAKAAEQARQQALAWQRQAVVPTQQPQRQVQSTLQAAPAAPTVQQPQPAITASRAQESGGLYVGQNLYNVLAQSPWPQELWPTVERIVRCESSGNTAAVGPLGHQGLLQADGSLHGAVPGDAIGQLTQGYSIYQKQGWGAWECY